MPDLKYPLVVHHELSYAQLQKMHFLVFLLFAMNQNSNVSKHEMPLPY